jgi:hypothetical protein
VFRALKKEVRDASGVDTERLSKNVSVQMMKTSFQKYLKTNREKRDTAQSIKMRPTLPIENNPPSIKIDVNCFNTVDNLSI